MDCRLPSPFSMKCDNQCFNITVRCNHKADCLDASDEPYDCRKYSIRNYLQSILVVCDDA